MLGPATGTPQLMTLSSVFVLLYAANAERAEPLRFQERYVILANLALRWSRLAVPRPFLPALLSYGNLKCSAR